MARLGVVVERLAVVIVVMMTMGFIPAKGRTTELITTESTTTNSTESISTTPNATSATSPGSTPILTIKATVTTTTTAPFANLGGVGGLIGVVVGGVALIVVIVVVICCCCCRNKRPPKPVTRDYNAKEANVHVEPRYPETSDDDADIVQNIQLQMQPVSDDIYGNVDMQGNMIRYNMPDENEHQSTPVHSSMERAKDFGDVYENTIVGQAADPVGLHGPLEIPTQHLHTSPVEEGEQGDFGGEYTNDIQIIRNARTPNMQFLPRNKPLVERQTPVLPGRPTGQSTAQQQPPRLPLLPTTQRDNFAFQDDDQQDPSDFPMKSPPPPPVKPGQPTRTPPPVSPKKIAKGHHQGYLPEKSLPLTPKKTTLQHFSSEVDELSDLPTNKPPAPPTSTSLKQTGPALQSKRLPQLPSILSKQKKPTPPSKSTKKIVHRYIDDGDNIKDNIEIGKPLPTTPDYGGEYEVVEAPSRQDYGGNYEVCDVQPKESPPGDFGQSYEYVDQTGQGGSTQHEAAADDYSQSYEVVNLNSPDYGGNYEVVEQPRQPAIDINRRAPMPIPNAQAPSREPCMPPGHQGNSGSDEPDFGGDYTNVSAPGRGSKKPKSMHPPRHQPALPQKVHVPNDFYDDALSMGEQTEDSGMYQNKQATSLHYRNLPKTKANHSQLEGYIKFNVTHQ